MMQTKVQILCYTGVGFNTCWLPSNVAANLVVSMCNETAMAQSTPIRFIGKADV